MSTEVTNLPADYYDFRRYVDRQRWLTYYRQLAIILSTGPESVLEIGVGPGIVRAVLRDRDVHVETVDINDSLGADHVADIRSLPTEVLDRQWDWVVCSRILHHIPAQELTSTVVALSAVKAKHILVSVPREDLSIQFTWRRTAGRVHHLPLSFGSRVKRLLRKLSVIRSKPSGQWMLDGSGGLSRDSFRSILDANFNIDDEYVLEDDPSHVFFVLRPR